VLKAWKGGRFSSAHRGHEAHKAPIVRTGAEGRELATARWGMPSSANALMEATKKRASKLQAKGKPVDFKELLRMEPDCGTTNIRNVKSKHWTRWLGVENRCVVPFNSFSEFNKAEGGDIWFALDESRPLACFAGIWTNWTSVRKVKEGETTNDLYAFLTTEPNAEVGAIHPKAMPVILTTPDEVETWMTAPPDEALVGNHGQPVERQHRAVAEMEAGQGGGEDQKRRAFKQSGDAADLGVRIGALVESSRFVFVDGILRNQQNRGDGQNAEQGGQPEHGGETELPSQQARQSRTDHVARMIEGLVMAILPVEAALTYHAERDVGDGGADRSAGDGGRNLRQRYQPEVLRNQNEAGGNHRADSGDDHVELFPPGRIDHGPGGRGHHHPGDAADSHHLVL
jgi:putative SOS response-associated peptidase YedK